MQAPPPARGVMESTETPQYASQHDSSAGSTSLPLSRPLRGPWLVASDDPRLAHDAVLRLTYGITLAVTALALVARHFSQGVPIAVILVLAGVLIVETGVQRHLLRVGKFTRGLAAVHIALALGVLTVGIEYSGGVNSPFVWVYAVPIAVEGVLRGLRWTLGTATASTIYLLGASGAVQRGLVTFLAPKPLSTVTVYLISYVGMFYVVALVTSILRGQVREMSRLASSDPLTGLGNRYALRQVMEREIARARRYHLPCSVAVVEIDRFKRFNDRYGHLHGDEILRRVAAMLRGSSRATDFPARFGGDEFVVVLPHTMKGEGTKVAERIRTDIEEFSLVRGFGLTVSVGLATLPEDGLAARALLDAADEAMYRAKQRGGNAVEIASRHRRLAAPPPAV